MEDTLPASRVLSSQIPGYDGGEVDTNETVEVMFPLNVRKCLQLTCNACYYYCNELVRLHALLQYIYTIISMQVYGMDGIHG